ncbi:MAG: hypothetical protein WCS53_00765 [Bacilli bacterium]
MFARIKVLALLQISNKYKIKRFDYSKRFRIIARAFLYLLMLVVLTVVFAGFTLVLIDIIGLPRNSSILTFVIVVMQAFGIVSCLVGLNKNLYTSKDNPILLAYPARPIEVYISKLLVYYIYELIKSISFFIPFFFGFGIYMGIFTALYAINTILMALILPVFPVLIGALVTIPLLFIKRIFQANAWLKGLFGIAGLVVLFIGLRYALSFLPVPLRILAMYDVFVDGLKAVIATTNQIATFYNVIGYMFFGQQIVQGYAILTGAVITLLLLIIFISRPYYLKMASRSSEHANLKKHKGENIVHTNTFFTFIRKEWLLTIRNPAEFISNYSFMIATPYVLFTMMTIFASVDRDKLGNIMLITFSLLITLLMATASNTASATAVTAEGQEFSLLKTAPGKVSNMAWAKIIFNLAFSTIMIILSYVLVILFCDRIDFVQPLLIMMGAAVLINGGLIFWSFQLDLLNPQLSEYAVSGASAHAKNFSKSITLGFLSSVLFTVLFMLFFLENTTDEIRNIKILALVLVFFATRFYFFVLNMRAYFKEIEP